MPCIALAPVQVQKPQKLVGPWRVLLLQTFAQQKAQQRQMSAAASAEAQPSTFALLLFVLRSASAQEP